MFALPFKANNSSRHHIPKQKFKVTNWSAYDASLRQRGSLTVWFTAEAVAAWRATPRTTRGGQQHHSPLAIVTALTLRALLGLDLAVPDHSTPSRRADTLQVPRPSTSNGAEPVHLLVDSTGLKLCGAGEWLHEKHGTKTRRAWKKLHLGVDAGTGQIVAATSTSKDVDDGSQVGPLLDQVTSPLGAFIGARSLATVRMISKASAPASPSATLKRRSSSRHAQLRCRAPRLKPNQRSATGTCGRSPSTAGWRGKGCQDTASVRKPRRRCHATNRSSVTHCGHARISVGRPRRASPFMC